MILMRSPSIFEHVMADMRRVWREQSATSATRGFFDRGDRRDRLWAMMNERPGMAAYVGMYAAPFDFVTRFWSLVKANRALGSHKRRWF